MKHSSSLAIWLGLGSAFLSLLTTFFAIWASQRKKAAANPATPVTSASEPKLS